MEIDLKKLVKSLNEFEGISRKSEIGHVTNALKDSYNVAGKTLLAFGDDASAIDIGDDKVVLMAADGIWGKLMDADPYWAGYCSVLVNVNDIAAMGAKPIAMVNVLSISDKSIFDDVLRGINDGCHKFNVPMVGGHLHPDSPYNSLDVSIIGVANKDSIITSSDANVGDSILVAIDLDGRQHPKFDLNWDTTTHKSSELVQKQIITMETLGKNKLVTAGKDISNPGILGTLGMLIEASECGAEVDLDKIPKADNVPLDTWLKLYPGSGFVLTAKNECVEECINILEEFSLNTNVVGKIIEGKKLYLINGNQKEVLFDNSEKPIVGL
ncbi:MAG: methanogenesis marker 2 protein [Methanobacteriaceae archaeon]